MRVCVIGAGPSGLYLSMLLKQRQPSWDVQVVEQNPPGATFGFGVVLAESGLQQLREADEGSHAAIRAAMRYNQQQVIVHRETPIEVRQHVRGGAITRLTLLQILTEHALKAGVRIHHGVHIASLADLAGLNLDDADVIVGADGVNSIVRKDLEGEFGTTRRSLKNHFAWYGTTRIFPAPALVFRKYQGGHFVAHYYAYSDTMSTFVAECDDVTWEHCGLDKMTDDERQQLFEEIFAPELEGEKLISNRSLWRQFPVIRNTRWTDGRHVLIGDALASAHFSIGSGTRLAMTDAIALVQALTSGDDSIAVPERLAAFEAAHTDQKNKLLEASEKSFDWYERMAEWMELYSPEEFVYRFMVRTGRVDDQRLKDHFPALMERLNDAGVAL